MKTIKYFLFIFFAAQYINAQSIVIGTGASIDVGLGADICAGVYGNITGTLTGDGTQCATEVPEVLNLIALIEGFYNGSIMVSDQVKVELRNSSSPYALVEQKDVSLNTSGSGTANFTSTLNSTPYYIVVKHRNSIETWSKNTQTFSGGVMSYDFTTAATKAYGDNLVLKSGKYCIWSGDVNQDGVIDALDRSASWNDRNLSGYLATDVNGDGTVDALDRSICWNNRNNIKKWPGAVLMQPIKINEVKTED
jgi:hypothetical protein